MIYFNSDGNESTMCGNGGRCLIKFAHQLNIIQSKCRFLAIDGDHDGEILADGTVSLKMKDVDAIERAGTDFVLNTGSPHYVKFVSDVQGLDVYAQGNALRYSDRFKKGGINVNFAEKLPGGGIFVRTYERGVEDETLSCGTGVVASALAFALETGLLSGQVNIKTPGGDLAVRFEASGNGFKNIYLLGPAQKVFEGIQKQHHKLLLILNHQVLKV